MGVASYSEDIWLRWSEAADPIPYIPLTTGFQCPFCLEILSSEVQRLAHLAAAHRGEAPELFIRGRRLGLEDRIREALNPADIALSSNCTWARISVDGYASRGRCCPGADSKQAECAPQDRSGKCLRSQCFSDKPCIQDTDKDTSPQYFARH